MEDQLTPLDHLLEVFDERNRLHALCNKQLAQMLSPTVLTALFELLEIPNESLVWEDFHVIDTVLVIHATITYDPAHGKSPFLAVITADSADSETPIQTKKRVQFGIPLANIFQDKDELKAWFMEVVQVTTVNSYTSTLADIEEEEPSPDEFDRSALSPEQLAQLLFYEKNNKGTQ